MGWQDAENIGSVRELGLRTVREPPWSRRLYRRSGTVSERSRNGLGTVSERSRSGFGDVTTGLVLEPKKRPKTQKPHC